MALTKVILQFRVRGQKVEGGRGGDAIQPYQTLGGQIVTREERRGEEQKLAAREGQAEHVHDEAVANNDHAFLTSCTISSLQQSRTVNKEPYAVDKSLHTCTIAPVLHLLSSLPHSLTLSLWRGCAS